MTTLEGSGGLALGAKGYVELEPEPAGELPRRQSRFPSRAVTAQRMRLVTAVAVFGDLAAVALGYLASHELWPERTLLRHLTLTVSADQGVYFTLPIWTAVLAICGLYERRWVGRRLLEAVSISVAAVALLSLVGNLFVSGGWIVATWSTCLASLALWRVGLRRVIRELQARCVVGTRVIIVGSDGGSQALVRTLGRQRWRGYEVAGFIRISDNGRTAPAAAEIPTWHSVDDLATAVRETDAGAVIVAANAISSETELAVERALEQLDVEMLLSPSLPHVGAARMTIRPMDGLALLVLRRHRFQRRQAFIKRSIDLVGSITLLTLSLPFMALIALAIRVNSRGPVLFRQVRVGEGGRNFVMYKFCTMVPDADARVDDLRTDNEADGVLFKLRDDPRVFRVGRVLRQYSLDELPQLLNVVRGEMSLVGPRPALPRETAQYDPEWRARLLVKPGLTGLWQVNGRHDLAFDDYIRYDLFYVANWSLALDFYVLARTVPAVLSRRGAA